MDVSSVCWPSDSGSSEENKVKKKNLKKFLNINKNIKKFINLFLES